MTLRGRSRKVGITDPRSSLDTLLHLVEPFAEDSAVFPEVQIDSQRQSGHADAIGPERAAIISTIHKTDYLR